MVGSIRVGRIKYENGEQIIPSYNNYENIICMTKSSAYGSLGPYCLKTEKGFLLENVWQFSKIYYKVPKSIQRYSRYNSKIIWGWKDDTFVNKNDKILPSYWNWRNRGMYANDPIRYPVGHNGRHGCIGAIKLDENILHSRDVNLRDYQLLDYIESRKQIYVPIYNQAVKKERKYNILKQKLDNNINLLICEVDVAYSESLDYYKFTYGVGDNFIENDTMLINKENLELMLNDNRHPFGHGYCLAASLLNIDLV